MPFAVSRTVWLAVEAERIKGLILMPRFWRRRWTDRSLHAALEEIGLRYTLPEVRELNDALHQLGVVEDVLQAEDGPAADVVQ